MAPERRDVNDFGTAERPCYAVHLVRPFLEVLRGHPAISETMLEQWQAIDPDDRIPVATVHRLLEAAAELIHDPDLGLKAARRTSLGDGGALDYLLSTSPTVKDAIEVAGRYMRLVNDTLSIRLELDGEEALMRLDNTIMLPRAAADFQAGSLFWNHARVWLRDVVAEVVVSFTHAAPSNRAEYERTFGPAEVRFSASFSGFVLRRNHLAVPLEKADPKLHDVIMKHARQLISELPTAESVTERARRVAARELAHGNPKAMLVATELGMSLRTLGRKLAEEGTTFKDVLDDLRKRLALQYVAGRDLALSDVALLLGFSETAAFHRAFRRWTGQTPLEYRRSHRR
ncbi:MAG TPA: AraC family transcriptional regulator [Polyangiaceae bacterium]|jgi:AraC-like DNA-binding protein|nr:AraC family transcriptional regulator [Polyangiaceae bacterium]